ncbi:MAG: hypothetical protein FJ279_00785, partial [Planctomycetes bacterium]|nr:hypothetical protein [Planctomycetota bacterium]
MFEQFRKIFSHSIVYGLGVIMSQAVGFLMIPVYTRYLTTQDYGVLELLMRTGSVVSMLLVMGLGTAVMRLYADCKSDEEKAKVVATAMFLVLGLGTVSIAVLLTCADLLSSLVFSAGDYSFLFSLLLICNFFEMSLVVPFTLLRAQDKSRFYVAISLGRLVLALSLNICFVVFMHKTVDGILYSSLITGALCSLLLVTRTLRQTGLVFSVTAAKDLLAYGLPL